MKARIPTAPLPRLAAVLAAIVAIDVLISSMVFVDRLDDPTLPEFRQADISQMRWDVDPYLDAPAALGIDATLRGMPPVGASSRAVAREKLRPRFNATYAIAALSRYEATHEPVWLRRAEGAVQQVLDDSEGGAVPHRYPATDLLGRPVEVPWYAAETQGLMLSALARLSRITRDPQWRKRADEIFTALGSFQGFFAGDRPAPEHWISSVDSGGYLWFDRFSTGLSSVRVLNEQLWTMVGVYDYRRLLADRPDERRQATRLFAGSLATVEDHLPRWRVPGQISVSSLEAENRDVRDHFAAIAQLKILGEITGSTALTVAATKFDRDDDFPFFLFDSLDLHSDVDAFSPLPRELQALTALDRPPHVTAAGVPTTVGGELDPAGATSYALALLASPESDNNDVRRAAHVVDQMLAGAEAGAIPHNYPTTDARGHRVPGPWYSAATQGYLLSALTRLQERTGEPRWRSAADQVFDALTQVRDYDPPSKRPWLVLMEASGALWFDRNLVTSGSPRSVSELMAAAIGLYDYWRLSHQQNARVYLAAAMTTLRGLLPAIRRPGGPAIDSLETRAGSKPLHPVIADRLRALAAVTGEPALARMAHLLREDEP